MLIPFVDIDPLGRYQRASGRVPTLLCLHNVPEKYCVEILEFFGSRCFYELGRQFDVSSLVEVLWEVFPLGLHHAGEYPFWGPIGSPQASTWLTNAIREIVFIDGLVMDHGVDQVLLIFGFFLLLAHVPIDGRAPHSF